MAESFEEDASQLVELGVQDYRDRNYKSAVTHLQKALDAEPENWRAKLYLAMSYYHGGETFTAYRHLAFLRDNCTETEIRGKAEAAIAAMNNEIQSKGLMPEMTCTLKKPVLPRPKTCDVNDN